MTVDLENILNEDDEKKNQQRKNKGKSIEREKKPRSAAQIEAFNKMIATKKEKFAAKKKAIEDAKQAEEVVEEEPIQENQVKPFPKPSNFNPLNALKSKPKAPKEISEPLKEIDDKEEEADEESEQSEEEVEIVKPKRKPAKKAPKKPAPKKKKKVIIEESSSESDDIDLSNWLGDDESSESDEYEQVYIRKKKPTKKIVKSKSVRQPVAQVAQPAQPVQQEDPLEKLHWRERARLRGF